MKTILTRVRGVLGVPLVYVIRHKLFPELERGDTAFGDEDDDETPRYTSHDHEMITRCPIIDDEDYTQSEEDTKAHGPFVPSFLTDSKKHVAAREEVHNDPEWPPGVLHPSFSFLWG